MKGEMKMENTKEKFDWMKNVDEKSLEDAWMLDYFDKTDARWVRSPFLTWNQVTRILTNLTHRKMRNRIDNMTSETFEDVDWSSVRIHSERELDVMVDENGKKELRNPKDKDYKFVPVCNKRTYLFGSGYDTAEKYRSGKWNPDDMRGWDIPKHCLEDRDDVIADLRDEYPDGIDWDDYDEEMSSYESKEMLVEDKPALQVVSDNE
jgi:hypothetical protein